MSPTKHRRMPQSNDSTKECVPSTGKRVTDAALLVRAAQLGDGRAFDALVRKFRPRIYALALHLTGSASEADDVTQDAFMKAYSRLNSFEGRSEFFTWLYRIALHKALNLKRDRAKRRTCAHDDPRIEAAISVDASGDSRRALELRESYAQLLAAFDRLSPLLRTTIVLTTLQGLSHQEAAVVLQTTEGTVAWRVHEARSQLRAHLFKLASENTPLSAVRKASEAYERAASGLGLEALTAALR